MVSALRGCRMCLTRPLLTRGAYFFRGHRQPPLGSEAGTPFRATITAAAIAATSAGSTSGFFTTAGAVSGVATPKAASDFAAGGSDGALLVLIGVVVRAGVSGRDVPRRN